MDAERSSETSVYIQNTAHNSNEDEHNLKSHRREELQFHEIEGCIT